MNQLIESGNVSKQKFSADPRPLDPNVPSSFLQDFVFKNFMYSKQDDYEKQLTQLYLSTKGTQKKIQAAPRQITITLFIIINKIVLLDIFVQLIR